VVDVVQRQPAALEHPLGGRDRPREHEQRVVADHCGGDDARPGAQAERGGTLLAHHEQGGCPVGDLRGVPGCDGPLHVREPGSELVGPERGPQGGEPFSGRGRADGLVPVDDHCLAAVNRRTGRFVVDRGATGVEVHRHGDRRDLRGEGHRGGPLVRPHGIGVQLLARQAVLHRDQLRGDALPHEPRRVPISHARAVHVSTHARRAHRHAAHRLDAGRDGDVVGTGHDRVHGEVERLLARPAPPVDGHGGDVLGKACGEPRGASRGGGLLGRLADAADEDVINGAGVDAGALHEALEHLAEQLHGVQRRQGAARPAGRGTLPLAHRGPDRIDDDGAGELSHGGLLWQG
jgi:hypothetical protein